MLVDYDIVRRGRLYRLIYFAVRWMLFWRDHMLILLMLRGVKVPRQMELSRRSFSPCGRK